MTAMIRQGLGPVPESAVKAAEIELDQEFPPDYRAFLMQTNGGYPRPAGFDVRWAPEQACADDWAASSVSWFYALTDNDDLSLTLHNRVTFAERLPPGTLTIAADAGGNQLLLAFEGPWRGKLLLWIKDHEAGDGAAPGYDNVGVVADSFTDFIQNRLR